MTKEQLQGLVNEVIKESHDPESAHCAEDRLHLRVIREFCPDWVVAEIDKLDNERFPRWCA